MRVWLLQGPWTSPPDPFDDLLLQVNGHPDADLSVEPRRVSPTLAEEVRAACPEVLALSGRKATPGEWLDDLLRAGPALVVGTSWDRAAVFDPLAEHHPVFLVPDPPTREGLLLALHSAVASGRRAAAYLERVAHLSQRLEDRIVIERAKGLLVQGGQLSEEQAYKRLRSLSRQQRRPLREIAQALLDSRALLTPGALAGADVLMGR